MKPIRFIGERLVGSGWADLAEYVLAQTAEVKPVEPQMAAIYYFPDRTPPEDQAA